MWMSAAQPRTKVYYTKKRELKVTEDHSIDPLAPIELEFERQPVLYQEQQRFGEMFGILKYLEFWRSWNQSYRVIPGNLRNQQKRTILKSIEARCRSIEEINAEEQLRKELEGEKN
jgi:hypothetical protein